LNFLLINSHEIDSFAALYINGDITISNASQFMTSGNFQKSPDKLIYCLKSLINISKPNLTEIDAISVTVGPGSFTGVRVGLALAKGLAAGLDKKIIQIDNFSIMLNKLSELLPGKKYCVLIKASNDEFYYALFENKILTSAGSIKTENLQNLIDNNTIIAGYFDNESIIKHRYLENIKNSKPEIDSMLELTIEKFRKNELDEPENAIPLYLKDFITTKSKHKNGLV
jgi:tRNA threonylcarbamoyladenosine biosynthesis protein TsaB